MVSADVVALTVAVVIPVASLALVLYLFYLKERQYESESNSVKEQVKGIQKSLKSHKTNKKKDDIVNKHQFLRAAFELQSRLSVQVSDANKGNWLHKEKETSKSEGNNDPLAWKYAKTSTLFFLCRYFFWAQQVLDTALLVGLENATEIYSLIDALNFQFTGTTETQGFDKNENSSKIFNIKIMDIQAIVAAMRVDATTCMSVHDFSQMADDDPPFKPEDLAELKDLDKAALTQAKSTNARHKRFQRIIANLAGQVEDLADLGYFPDVKDLTDEEVTARTKHLRPPQRRMAIIQVLLCKLIDLLDNARPWDEGPMFDPDEEPRIFQRDIRIVPLLKLLTPAQRTWLKGQPFFRDDPDLLFPGFREDIPPEKKSGKEFPSAVPRKRDNEWLRSHLSTQGPAARSTMSRRRQAYKSSRAEELGIAPGTAQTQPVPETIAKRDPPVQPKIRSHRIAPEQPTTAHGAPATTTTGPTTASQQASAAPATSSQLVDSAVVGTPAPHPNAVNTSPRASHSGQQSVAHPNGTAHQLASPPPSLHADVHAATGSPPSSLSARPPTLGRMNNTSITRTSAVGTLPPLHMPPTLPSSQPAVSGPDGVAMGNVGSRPAGSGSPAGPPKSPAARAQNAGTPGQLQGQQGSAQQGATQQRQSQPPRSSPSQVKQPPGNAPHTSSLPLAPSVGNNTGVRAEATVPDSGLASPSNGAPTANNNV